jgi:hypothetical protein
MYALFIVVTITSSFPFLLLIIALLTKLTQRAPLVDYEMPSFPDIQFYPILSGVLIVQAILVVCSILPTILICSFPLDIAFCPFSNYAFDYLYGIPNFFLQAQVRSYFIYNILEKLKLHRLYIHLICTNSLLSYIFPNST